MAGKSPWGGKKSGGEPDVPAHDEPHEPAEPKADKPDKPKGPRNPWLPPEGEPRRSASIEDIFKHRGPEGPRRTGGGVRSPRPSRRAAA